MSRTSKVQIKRRKGAFLVLILFLIVTITILPPISAADSWVRDDSIGTGIDSHRAQIKLIHDLENDSLWRAIYVGLDGYYYNGSSWISDNSILAGLQFPNHPNEYIYNLTGQEDWTAVATIGQTATGFYWNGSQWIEDNSRVAGITEALISSGGIFTAYGYDFEKGFIDDNYTFWLNAYDGIRIGYYWNGTYWVQDDRRVNGLPASFGWQMFYDSSCGEWNAITCGWYGELDKISAYYWNGSKWIEDSERAPKGFSDSSCSVAIGENLTGDGSRWLLIAGASEHLYGFKYVESCDQDNDGVLDKDDKCPNTIGQQLVYGCSCDQILALKSRENTAINREGCSKGVIEVFTKGIGWAKDLFG